MGMYRVPQWTMNGWEHFTLRQIASRKGNRMTEQKIYDWSLLNRICAGIVEGLLDRWKGLLDSEESEPHYQAFLAEHAGLFFGLNGTNCVISQLQLGTSRKPDFVVVHDNRSGGAHYE